MATPNDATVEDMNRFFQEAGWTARPSGETSWELGYQGNANNWMFSVNMTEYWVYFYCTILNHFKEECRANIYEHLALLNYKISFGKFGATPDGRITLGVELPRENLKAASMVKDALNTLAYNADEQYLELINIANDPSKVSSLRAKPEEPTSGQGG